MRVLITERDPLVCRWLREVGRSSGVELMFAASGHEVMATIHEQQPDCVVLDASSSAAAQQPLWQRLRERPETRAIPILVYSSSSRWQTLAELAGRSVEGYLPRPFTPQAMLDAAQHLVGRMAPAAA